MASDRPALVPYVILLFFSRMRIGSVTGPKPILERISLHMQASVMHASSLSQVSLHCPQCPVILYLRQLAQWLVSNVCGPEVHKFES